MNWKYNALSNIKVIMHKYVLISCLGRNDEGRNDVILDDLDPNYSSLTTGIQKKKRNTV